MAKKLVKHIEEKPILEKDIPRDKKKEDIVVKYTNGSTKEKPAKKTKDDKKTWAKTVNGKPFILLDESNSLYNHLEFIKPTGASSRRPAKFVKVTKAAFDNYLKFLTSNNTYYLSLARRSTNNG